MRDAAGGASQTLSLVVEKLLCVQEEPELGLSVVPTVTHGDLQ